MEQMVLWIACLVVLLTVLTRKFLPREKLNLPPGPKPWPVIGNLNLIGSLPHRSIHELSRTYGPIMQLRFGSRPVVIGSSLEMAKTFLRTMDANFADRPRFAAGKYTTYNYTNITWSPYGPYWRQARKMCLMELFSPKRIKSYEYMRVEEINSLTKQIFASSGKPIFIMEYLSTVSLNVISRMVLGKSYLDPSDRTIFSAEEFKAMIDEWFVLNGVLNIGDYIPSLSFLDLQGYVKRMKNLNKKFDKFLEYVLIDHEQKRSRNDNKSEDDATRDMLDVLLDLADDPDLEVKISRDGVKAFTQDLLVGGTESSATTLEWVLSELVKKPEIFKKAITELDSVVGQNRWVTEADIPKLPYIEAIVMETMRIHPIAPMLSPRVCRENCKVGGYDIKKGTMLLVHVWTIGRDPSLWENPNDFCPERFIGRDIGVKGHDFEFLPFGSGRRMCPGYGLGLLVIQASLANLIHGFNWKLADNIEPGDLNMEETFGLSTPRKFPLKLLAEPRLPLELYHS